MLENLPCAVEWLHLDENGVVISADAGVELGQGAVLRLLDQRKLPHNVEFIDCKGHAAACRAIKELAVRGAPAIGDAGAFALVLWAQNEWPQLAGENAEDIDAFLEALDAVAETVAQVRPTAVNLSWAVGLMQRQAHEFVQSAKDKDVSIEMIAAVLEAEAAAILKADELSCKSIGQVGAEEFHHLAQKLGRPLRVETHCNAGSLACARYGTALSVIYHAHAAGDIEMVWVDETRPVDQGARLTAWELMRAGVPCTLICDNMAGSLMQAGKVDAVVVGADRICANGDFANKIGTYPLAVLAQHHGVPFYTAAPASTFDMALSSGEQIVIEERPAQEVRCAPIADGAWQPIAPADVPVFNPAFDVTPHELLAGIFTEDGIQRP